MKKIAIKVIKRKDVAKKTSEAAEGFKGSIATNHKIVEAVNGWIFDVQVNRDKKKVISKNTILSWELLSKTFEKSIDR